MRPQDIVRLPERLLPEVLQVSENAVGRPYDRNIPLHPYAQPPQNLRYQVRDSFFDASGVVGAARDPFDAGAIYDMELVMQGALAGATARTPPFTSQRIHAAGSPFDAPD